MQNKQKKNSKKSFELRAKRNSIAKTYTPSKMITIDITKTKSIHLHPGEMIKFKAGSAKTVVWTNPKSSYLQIKKTVTSEKPLTTKTISSKNIVVKSITSKTTSKKIKAMVNGKKYNCTIYLQGYVTLKGSENFFINKETKFYIGGLRKTETPKTTWKAVNTNDKHSIDVINKDNSSLTISSSNTGEMELKVTIKTEAGYQYKLEKEIAILKKLTEEDVQAKMLQFPIEKGYENKDPWGEKEGGCNRFAWEFSNYIFGDSNRKK